MKTASVTLLLLTIHCGVAGAQENPKPWWNPFAKSSAVAEPKTDVKESSFFGGSPTAAFKMPSMTWLPGMSGTKKSKAGPSALTKMTRSSKKMWNNTVDFLNPFDKPAPQKQLPWDQSQTKKQPESASSWAWPWSPKPKPEPPSSVSDFLRQPRPQF